MSLGVSFLPFNPHNHSLKLSANINCRIVEANLLIICGSLPTLRVFLRTVAPGVLGENSTKALSGQNNGSGSFGLQTFGGSNKPGQKFDTLIEFERDCHLYSSNLRPDRVNVVEVDVRVSRCLKELPDRQANSEAESEDGILQTCTTTISYSDL